MEIFFPAIILENETLEEATSEENKGCSYLQKYRRRGGIKKGERTYNCLFKMSSWAGAQEKEKQEKKLYQLTMSYYYIILLLTFMALYGSLASVDERVYRLGKPGRSWQ